MAESHSIVWLDPVLLIHSSIDGHLDRFPPFGCHQQCCVNIRVQVFVHLFSILQGAHSLFSVEQLCILVRDRGQ